MGSIPGLGRSLEEELATHSSILVGKILWTEETGGIHSTGSQRVKNLLAVQGTQELQV